jgi:hypothetical protein
MTKPSNPGPIHVVRFGNIRVAVWENRNQEGRTYHSLDLERSYRDKEGAWQSQNINLRPNEIAKVTGALAKVYADLHTLPELQRSGDGEETSG